MPVSEMTNEQDPHWNVGSIKQKILQWESIENISKTGSKSQPRRERPKLLPETFQHPEPSFESATLLPKQTKQTTKEDETNNYQNERIPSDGRLAEPRKSRHSRLIREQSREEERPKSKERPSHSKLKHVRHKTSDKSIESRREVLQSDPQSLVEAAKTKVKRHKSKEHVQHQSGGESPRRTRVRRQQSIDEVQQSSGNDVQQSPVIERRSSRKTLVKQSSFLESESNGRTVVAREVVELTMGQPESTHDVTTVEVPTLSERPELPHTPQPPPIHPNEHNSTPHHDVIDTETSDDWYVVDASDIQEEEEITSSNWPIKSRKVESLEDEEAEVEISFKPEIDEVYSAKVEVMITRAVDEDVVLTKENAIDKEASSYLYPNDEYESEHSAATTLIHDDIDTSDYKKILGHATMKAEPYEVKLTALLYLRCINQKKDFRLASSVDGAGCFDNIVLKYKSTDEDNATTWRTCFIQLKTKENTSLTPEALISPASNFSLEKDFKSYTEIKDKISRNSSEEVFKGSFEECSFILYTNAKVSEKLALRLREKSIDDIEKLLRSGLNDELIFTLSEENDVDIYAGVGAEKREFLKKLKVFTGQPSENELDHLIKMELRAACSNYLSNVHIIYRFFIEAVMQWWTDEHKFLTQKINLLDKAENILNVYNLTATQKPLYRLPDVTFKANHLEQWQSEIRKKNALMCIVTTDMTAKFSATKLMQILWEENVEYIFTSLRSLLIHDKEVIPEWMSGEKDMLVIVSEVSDEHEELCDELCKVIKRKPHKQLVILSPMCDAFTTNLQLKYGLSYEELYDPFDLLQLDKESTDQILEKEVRFQGCPIYLRCISGEDLEKISQVLTSDNFDALVDNATINIGDEIDGHVDNYKPRTFERCDVIKQTILSADDFWGVIAVSNVTADELQQLVPPGNKVGVANEALSHALRYLVLDSKHPEDDYDKLCETRTDVHWLHMDDEALSWKRSQRNITSLAPYFEDVSTTYRPEHVLDMDDRVMLVVADAKTGMSTLMAHFAKETKLADPSMWVIKVNLKDHVKLFDEISAEDLNAFDFLSAVSIDHANSSFLARDLLRHSVEDFGNVAVFIDGFDEVVPRYLRKALALLTSLLQTKVKKIFITTRYSMKYMLESNLSTLAYRMCPLEYNKDDTSELFV